MKTGIKGKKTVLPKIRGNICLTAHPEGCRRNIEIQINETKKHDFNANIKNVLVIGSSTGYGLASAVTALFGLKANVLGICYEKPAGPDRTATAGYYNTAALHGFADSSGLKIRTIIGDAFSNEIKHKAVEELKRSYGKLDLIIYSIAAPKRKDPFSDTVYKSVIKPIGEKLIAKTIDLNRDQVINQPVEPATIIEIHETVKVMGGGDWELWINTLIDEKLINSGCKTLAYSYIGSPVTEKVYRSGTIGAAKEDLEKTALYLNEKLKNNFQGNAWVCVNKALVTQASSVIPSIPLYLSILFDILKNRDESCIGQIIRLFSDYLDPGKQVKTDSKNRIRLDNIELEQEVQNNLLKRWEKITDDNLYDYSDPDKFRNEFLRLFGFRIDGINYNKPVETNVFFDYIM
jgi:enoyl-[acyl-carrier protein] reductase/trans-2-enoyl-CoA reductase (NAD+)